MKLKYYLRGLGIGMIVTALILGISFSNRQDLASQTMTDDQIRERAAELGMVDSSELTLAALQNSASQPTESTPEETTQTQEQNTMESTPETTAPAETQETQTTAEPTPTAEPEATATPEPEKTAAPEATAEPEATNAPEQIQTAGITIQRGDDSGSVSRRLYEAGLVENAKAFDNYLCNNGYSRSINPGTYEIAPGTSEEEIAKIITGKH